MRLRRGWPLISLLAVVVVSVAGCRQLLDIEDARLEVRSGVDSGSSPGKTEVTPPVTGPEETQNPVSPKPDAGKKEPPEETMNEPDASSQPAEGGAPGSDPVEDAGPPPPPPPPPENDLCISYCLDLQKNCTDEYEQFQELSICLDVCAVLPQGNEDDKKTNTVHCRARHAHSARLEPFTHCKFAGLLSHGECGNNCEAFCDVMDQACTRALAGSDSYNDREACLEDCNTLPDLGDFTTHASKGMFSGNHVQCRAFHASAATEEADYHCAHAVGDFPCRDEEE